MAVKRDKKTKAFLEQMGDSFHLRYLEYLKIYASGEELAQIKDEEIITINYDDHPEIQGSYSISYKDLKAAAKKELKQLEKKLLNQIQDEQ
jgi:predicted nucleic acid-binding OB-fold protein